MVKSYIYKGETFHSEKDVREAIFKSQRKAFGQVPSENVVEFWAKHDVTYSESEDPIDVLKARKLNIIKGMFLNWRSNDATFFSSLGFKIDSNERANADINGLLVAYEGNQDALITFRDADNQFHSLTYAQLKTLQLEIVENGNFAYAQKWGFEAKVGNASTKAELDEIVVEFVGKNFSEE